jgi:hypothetical protein
MKRTTIAACVWPLVPILSALFVVAGCAPPSPVVQGKVISVSATEMRVQDERRPEVEPLAIDITTAEMGHQPVVGHTVRVVYREQGNLRRALAVMDVTRQEGLGQQGR